MKKRVLFVLTNHTELGDTGKFTGFHLAETAKPYLFLKKYGVEVDFASPMGGRPLPDAFDLDDKDNAIFWEDEDVQGKLGATLTPEMAEAETYAGIFFAGGHGAMWDFPNNLALQELTRDIYEKGGFVAAVCHGPAALINVKLSAGNYLIAGKKFSAFTNEEERRAEKENVVPFLLETALRGRGVLFKSGKAFKEHVIMDSRIITGQNPASAKAVAEKMVGVLEGLEYKDPAVSH